MVVSSIVTTASEAFLKNFKLLSALDSSTLFPDVSPVLNNPVMDNVLALHSSLDPVGSPTLKFPAPSIQIPLPVPRALAAPSFIEAEAAVALFVKVMPAEDIVSVAIVQPEAPPSFPVLAVITPVIVADVAVKAPVEDTVNTLLPIPMPAGLTLTPALVSLQRTLEPV